MTARRHLVIFARAPRLGRTKRRLAREIGDVPAWRFSRDTLRRLLRRFADDPRWVCWLAVTPDAAARGQRGQWPQGWPKGWPRGCRLLPQGRGDLGARMSRVFHALPAGPAVIIGSDIPGIATHHIVTAFRRLGDHDAVFGPAPDGGYWLVGFRRRPIPPVFRPAVFRDVRWSSPHALADTLANIPARLRYGMLDELEDIDDAAAYHRYRRSGLADRPPSAGGR